MTEASLCTESDLAQLNILSRSSTDKLKFLEDFSKILKDRITLQDYYIKELNKFISQLDQLESQEVFGNIFAVLKTVYNYKLNVEQSFQSVLKKDIVENLQGIIKRQAGDFEILTAERKQLERDHKHFFERMEMAQKNYFLHGRERDAVALEKESIALFKKQSVQRQNKVAEKEKNMTKIWSNSETSYKAQIADYNTYLNKFGNSVRGINEQLSHHEIERLTLVRDICTKLVYNESGANDTSNAMGNFRKSIEDFDVEKEFLDIIREGNEGQASSLKMELEQYQSYFQKELSELLANPDEKEEALTRKYRKFFEEIVKNNNSPEDYKFTVADIMPAEQAQELDQRINFISRLVDMTWRGKNVETEELKTFHQMLGEKQTRKIFTIAMQQYRLCGKFILSEEGFNNIVKVLVHFLYACQNSKDAMSIVKVLILSLTFWKEENPSNKKKQYLHSKIVWHPVWRDLDFWSTAVFLSIREELKSQKGLEKEESVEETIDREKNIVYGQLLSFSHNMVTFMVEKTEIKKIMEKFVGFYEIENDKLKLLVNNTDGMIKKQEQSLLAEKARKQELEQPKEIKISIISNYFTKKPSTNSESNESDANKQICDNMTKMIEDFKSEYEDENLFMDVYGTRGFSFGGESLSATSPEKFHRRGLSYCEEPITKKPELRPASTGKKKFAWF